MKKSHVLIAVLSALCLLIALISFFLPTQNGLILSRFVLLLAIVVSILCVCGVADLLLGNHSAE